MKTDEQIKSKERVSLFGEVYTSKKIVNNMLDLVGQETERIDSRFLEPACGDGNFLIEVLDRKMEVLEKKYKNNQFDFEKNSVVVISSIYGIDLLEDNVNSTRFRLLTRFEEIYNRYFKDKKNIELIKSIKFILNMNIIHGDALSLKQINSNNPVTFCEWSVFNNKIKRRDFTFSNLIAYSPFEKNTLFSDIGEKVIIPNPLKEYPLVNFDQAHKAC